MLFYHGVYHFSGIIFADLYRLQLKRFLYSGKGKIVLGVDGFHDPIKLTIFTTIVFVIYCNCGIVVELLHSRMNYHQSLLMLKTLLYLKTFIYNIFTTQNISVLYKFSVENLSTTKLYFRLCK